MEKFHWKYATSYGCLHRKDTTTNHIFLKYVCSKFSLGVNPNFGKEGYASCEFINPNLGDLCDTMSTHMFRCVYLFIEFVYHIVA